LLLRPTAPKRFIQRHLADVEVRSGSLEDPASLATALAGISHVIHCAGSVRAGKISDFYTVNQQGTRNLIEAVNQCGPEFRRLLLLSSLAAAGPALPSNPVRERDEPRPISDYGRSKLAGEREVHKHCRTEFVILRPPAVYGPRDGEFLRLFKAVQSHLAPRPSPQPLSLVFVKDLAIAVVNCLEHPAAAGKTYFVAAEEIVTARSLADEIAAQMGGWTIPLPLPAAFLWPICLAQEIGSRLTGKPNVLSLQKFAELRAPGWVCDPALLQKELGIQCPTSLKAGIAQTLLWYRENGWLSA
jgi:nucleoside-diphosphate-sugar epimerase